jgi:hypothetical protein
MNQLPFALLQVVGIAKENQNMVREEKQQHLAF